MNKVATVIVAGLFALSPSVALAASDAAAKRLQDNKAVATLAQELWSSAPSAPASDIFADDYINRQAAHDADDVDTRDLQAYLAIVDEFHGAFSDATVTIHSQIAEGDMVSTRWSNTLTRTGEFLGVAPSHDEYTYNGIQIDRFKDGKIVESWVYWDKFNVYQDLGLIDPLKPAT